MGSNFCIDCYHLICSSAKKFCLFLFIHGAYRSFSFVDYYHVGHLLTRTYEKKFLIWDTVNPSLPVCISFPFTGCHKLIFPREEINREKWWWWWLWLVVLLLVLVCRGSMLVMVKMCVCDAAGGDSSCVMWLLELTTWWPWRWCDGNNSGGDECGGYEYGSGSGIYNLFSYHYLLYFFSVCFMLGQNLYTPFLPIFKISLFLNSTDSKVNTSW